MTFVPAASYLVKNYLRRDGIPPLMSGQWTRIGNFPGSPGRAVWCVVSEAALRGASTRPDSRGGVGGSAHDCQRFSETALVQLGLAGVDPSGRYYSIVYSTDVAWRVYNSENDLDPRRFRGSLSHFELRSFSRVVASPALPRNLRSLVVISRCGSSQPPPNPGPLILPLFFQEA